MVYFKKNCEFGYCYRELIVIKERKISKVVERNVLLKVLRILNKKIVNILVIKFF